MSPPQRPKRPQSLEEFIRDEGVGYREGLAKQLFNYLDYDGSGVLEVFEIKRALNLIRTGDEFGAEPELSIHSKSSFHKMPIPDVSMELLRDYVREALDTVRREEEQASFFLPFLLPTKDQLDYRTFRKLLLLIERRAWDLYRSIDVNGDGVLNAAEIKRAALIQGLHLKLEDAHAFVDALDRNNDGSVDFTEFRRFIFTVPAVLRRDATLQDVFSAYQFVYAADVNLDHVPWALQRDALKEEQMRYFAAGAMAGVTSRTLTAPIDRIRIYFQIQTANDFASARKEGLLKAIEHVARNFRTAIAAIYANGGIFSFFRGNALNCARIVPESAIGFFVMEKLLAYWQKRDELLEEAEMRKGLAGGEYQTTADDDFRIYLSPTSRRFFAGAVAGTCGQCVAYPIESVRMRVMSMQRLGAGFDSSLKISRSTMGLVDTHVDVPGHALFKRMKAEYPSFIPGRVSGVPCFTYSTAAQQPIRPQSQSLVLRAIREIHSEAGIYGFYRGLLPASLSMAPFMGLNMAVFEFLKTWHHRRSDDPHLTFGHVLLYGCISGSTAAASVYPLQLVRVRMQAQGSASLPVRYDGLLDCFAKTYGKEGIRGFYRGLGVSLSKVAPATGLAFVSYERAKEMLGVG